MCKMDRSGMGTDTKGRFDRDIELARELDKLEISIESRDKDIECAGEIERILDADIEELDKCVAELEEAKELERLKSEIERLKSEIERLKNTLAQRGGDVVDFRYRRQGNMIERGGHG